MFREEPSGLRLLPLQGFLLLKTGMRVVDDAGPIQPAKAAQIWPKMEQVVRTLLAASADRVGRQYPDAWTNRFG